MATSSSRSTSRVAEEKDDGPKVKAADADAGGAEEKGEREVPARAPEGGSGGGTAYLNTTTGPVVYDKAGHQVDAAGWTPAISLDAVGKAARQAGHLLPESAL